MSLHLLSTCSELDRSFLFFSYLTENHPKSSVHTIEVLFKLTAYQENGFFHLLMSFCKS